MAMNDPIADMLTRIRNANHSLHKEVAMPSSKIKVSIASILKEKGFIEGFDIKEDGVKKNIVIHLKYGSKNERVIKGLKRISRGGCRFYVDKTQIPLVQGGIGIAILSTSKGVISDFEARDKNVGGELICKVW